MKKAITLVVIGLAILSAFLYFTGEVNSAKAILTVTIIVSIVFFGFYIMPKQEGAMNKAMALIVMGFAIGLPGWLITALAHIKAGMVLFVIGWLTGATGMAMALWNIELSTSQRLVGVAFKIGTIGFAIYAVGGLLEWLEYMELSNILTKIGFYIVNAGIFVGFLGVIEDRMQ